METHNTVISNYYLRLIIEREEKSKRWMEEVMRRLGLKDVDNTKQ